MSSGLESERKWNERSSDGASPFAGDKMFRFFFEHAPEAIVVLDCEARRFVLSNENAERLFGLTREELLKIEPAALSPVTQPNGQLSIDAAREWLRRTLEGETPVVEWIYRHASGKLLSCELRLLRLPG